MVNVRLKFLLRKVYEIRHTHTQKDKNSICRKSKMTVCRKIVFDRQNHCLSKISFQKTYPFFQ